MAMVVVAAVASMVHPVVVAMATVEAGAETGEATAVAVVVAGTVVGPAGELRAPLLWILAFQLLCSTSSSSRACGWWGVICSGLHAHVPC